VFFIENYCFIYYISILRYLLLAIKAKGAFITFLIATFVATFFNFGSINCYIPFLFKDRFLAAFSFVIACFLAIAIALFSTIILFCSSFFIFFCNSSSFIFGLLCCFFLLLLLYICYLCYFKVLGLLHCLRAK
jgi:hypothetical protein